MQRFSRVSESQSDRAARRTRLLKSKSDYAKQHPRRNSQKAKAKAKANNVNASKRHALNAYPKRPRRSPYSKLIRQSAGASSYSQLSRPSERGDT